MVSMYVGKHVRLASNPNVIMSVSKINDDETVVCKWISKSSDKLQAHIFDKCLLEVVGKNTVKETKLDVAVGQVVKLKIGNNSLKAVVNKIIDSERVVCSWISKDTEELQTEEIEIVFLCDPAMNINFKSLEMAYR